VHLDQHDYSPDELAEAVLLTPEEFERDLMHAPRSPSNVVSLFGSSPQPAIG